MSKKKIERPKYIIKVNRDWRYGKRARFWDIQEWKQMGKNPEEGYWGNACRGGLAYTEWGMWRAIDKRLKKMKFGYSVNHFTLDRQPLEDIK
jgi:hypothetical protein